jgi:hypothetical protein
MEVINASLTIVLRAPVNKTQKYKKKKKDWAGTMCPFRITLGKEKVHFENAKPKFCI